MSPGDGQATQWFLQIQGRQKGPFSARQLKAFAAGNKVSHDTLVRRGDRDEWGRAGTVRGLFDKTSASHHAEDCVSRAGEDARNSSATTSAKAIPAFPAPLPGGPPPLGGPREYSREFEAFLASHPDGKPLLRFKARAALGADIPRFCWSFPLGDVLLFQGFLAFLTQDASSPGWSMAAKNAAMKLMLGGGGGADITSLIEDFQDRAANAIEDYTALRTVIDNRNSICVPYRALTQLEFFRGIPFFRTTRIRITFTGGSLVLCQDEQAEFGGTWMVLSGRWHLDFVEKVRAVIKSNAGTQ